MTHPALPQILIVAGEASGDHYGAQLVHKITELNPHVRFFGMGGDRMAACGVDLVHHIREVSVMGFTEVLARLGPLYRSFRALVDASRERRPRAAVFIDFPDYNLRLAPKIRQATGARTVYYIGPTIWAWRPGRVRTVKSAIDRMLVIFPFEEPLYRAAGVDVEFVGHPLVGTVRAHLGADAFRAAHGIPAGPRLVGLLPGSRAREVAHILPVLCRAAGLLAARHAPLEVALGLADSVERAQVEALLRDAPVPVRIVERATHDLMKHADVLLVACGTAPLEAALLGTPQVVVYRTAPLTYGIAARLVRVPHACIVNLILERRAVPELVQHELTPERVAAEADALLAGPAADAQREAFRELGRRIGSAGAAKRAARAVMSAAGLTEPVPAGALP